MESKATLAKKEKEFLECQDNLQNIKTHARGLQTFVGLKQIEAEKTKNELLSDYHQWSNDVLVLNIYH
jgi:hypothetical protein